MDQAVVDPGGKQLVDLALGRIARECDHGNPPRRRILTEATEHLGAREVGQMDVEQDEVRLMLPSQLQTDTP